MATYSTETSGRGDSDSSFTPDRIMGTIKNRGRDGSLALLLGSVLLAWALKSLRNRTGRGAIMGLLSVALLGYGVRQRLAGPDQDRIETGTDARRDADGSKRVSDEAHAEVAQDLGAHRNADESAGTHQSETAPNPRGMSDRSDVDADDEGEIDYVEGKDPGSHSETQLEDDDAKDSRLDTETDDDQTEVDLSEAAMADESSEATGPHPEQAYPASEGTDPEPTSEEAPERVDDDPSTDMDTADESTTTPDESGPADDQEATTEQTDSDESDTQ